MMMRERTSGECDGVKASIGDACDLRRTRPETRVTGCIWLIYAQLSSLCNRLWDIMVP